MHNHGNSSNNFGPLLLGSIKENIVPESGPVAIFEVAVPCPSIVFVCVFANCGLTGSQSSSELSQELILLGEGTIWKCLGSWEGQ
jgi:hypothetical protein